MKTKQTWTAPEIKQINLFLAANEAITSSRTTVSGKVLKVHHTDEQSDTPSCDLRITRDSEDSFSVERFCYRGSVDDWIPLTCTSLEGTNDIIQHLGKFSFYGLS